MSEKEILEAINILEYFEPDELVESVMYETSMKKIKKLLDLYKKQQKEIEKLENDKRGMLIELYKANDKKYKAEKEIKKLKDLYSNEKIRNTIIKRYREVIEKDYISKNKIREFIKNNLPDNEIMQCCDTYDVNGVSIRKKLEKLLKE